MTPFPKGPTRKAEQAGKRRHKADIIRAVRVQVMQRDTACRVCGSTRDAEMHEIVPRSILRGRAPEAIYTLHNCLRLCGGPKGCHGKVTRHDLAIVVVDPLRGANAPLRFTRVIRRPYVPTPPTD
jgi:5-methylcytosine-specific restriction endonuclease McrA